MTLCTLRTLRTPLVALSVSLTLVPVACTETDDKDIVNGATTTTTTGGGGNGGTGGGVSGVEAKFELPTSGAPDFLAVPFPSDLYLDANGVVADIPGVDGYIKKGADLMVGGMKGIDGFGATAGAIFRLDTRGAAADAAAPEIDVTTLPADESASLEPSATAVLVDLEATDPMKALIPSHADYHDDTQLGSKLRPGLVVMPGRGQVLEPGHRYAAVITTGIKTKGGDAISPSPTLAAIASGDKRATDAEKLYGAAIDKVASLVTGLSDKTKIADIAVWTTSTSRQELVDLRADLATQQATTPPALSWDAADLAPMGLACFAKNPVPANAAFVATLDQWLGNPDKLDPPNQLDDDPANDQANGKAHDAIAAIGTAVFDAPNFLTETPTGYTDPAHQVFARDASGKAIVNPDKPTAKVWVTIALPSGVVPAAGFPVVVVQHGLGGDRSFLLAIANQYAKRGWATVAIESVTFGARATAAADTTDAAAGFAWSADANRYDGPDGFVDQRAGATDFFGVLQNLGALRDHLRQSVLDVGTLVDVLRNPSLDLGPLLDAVPGAKLDGDHVAYMGNSLGGIMGAMVAASDPYIKTFVLNVAGGGLLTELPNGPIISSYLNQAGVNFLSGKTRFAPTLPLLQLMQHVVDAGDPLVYAKNLVTAPATPTGGTALPRKNILQFEAIWDEWVSNESNEALAYAAGLPLADPSTGPHTKLAFATVDGTTDIVDVPVAGVTAVLVQVGPAAHGSNLFDRQGDHGYAIPWPQWDKDEPYTKLAAPFTFDQPAGAVAAGNDKLYLGLQLTMNDFIETSFAGPAVVHGLLTPVLDFDADGALDADDADPSDPTKQ